MATAPTALEPPVYDPPLVDHPTGQRHSQAWTEYHQSVSDRLAVVAADRGVTDGSDATAGRVGEYLEASLSSVGLANNVPTNVVTLALTAGDWDVEGNVQFTATGILTLVQCGVSTISANWDRHMTSVSGTLGTASGQQLGSGGVVRFNVSAAATAYLVAMARFTSGGVTSNGKIWARRVR